MTRTVDRKTVPWICVPAVLVVALVAYVLMHLHGPRSLYVSMPQLLVEPREYEGDRVIVHGFLRDQDGLLRLFTGRDNALIRDNASSLVLGVILNDRSLILSRGCNDAYVEVIGTFGVVEELQLYGVSALESLTRIDPSQTPGSRTTCWP